MDQTPRRPPSRPGLDPRDALDMLDIRTRREQQTAAAPPNLRAAPTPAPMCCNILPSMARPPCAPRSPPIRPHLPSPTALLADDDAEDVRAELAVKIGRLMPGLSERESSHIFALTIETLECLARDASVRVRAILAEEIKSLDCIPRDIALMLARDIDSHRGGAHPAIFAAALRRRPGRDHRLRPGAGSPHRHRQPQAGQRTGQRPAGAVAGRAAVAALLVNPDAKIRKETMDRIIEQAEDINAWHMPLALRADLSARAIRRIGSLVGASILERLAARNDLSDATRIHLNRELRARLAESPAVVRRPMSPADMVAAARKEGRLDGAFVEQAAQAGQREIVVLALAQLANVSEQTVKKILSAGNAKPIVALVWHTHLSMRVAFKIQTFVMKLPTPRHSSGARRRRLSAQQGRDALASQLFQHFRLIRNCG